MTSHDWPYGAVQALDVVRTVRLAVVSLPPALVAALAAGDLASARLLAPYDVGGGAFAGDEHVLGLRHAQLQADPGEQPWLLRAAVVPTAEVVGRIGFHAPPDADGVVEIGYTVAPPHRRQGYAREMTVAMLGWAAARGARRCLASVSPGNPASLALVRGLGFVHVGEQVDEIDGLELVHSLALAVPPSR